MGAIKEIRTVWKGGMSFESMGRDGVPVVMDAAPEFGGQNRGLTPMELLLVALAGCTAMDVITILQKKREQVTGFEVITRGVRAGEHPRIYTEIEVEYVVRGHGINPQSVERAIELSETKYCSVSNMLNKAARLITRYRIEEAG